MAASEELPSERELRPAPSWHVYCLASNEEERHTYVGATIDPDRRLTQHNGRRYGGAKATKRLGPDSWHRVLCVSGFPDERAALQFEWRWKHPGPVSASRKGALPRRVAALKKLLLLERPTKTALPFADYPGELRVEFETESARAEWLAVAGELWPIDEESGVSLLRKQ